MIRPIEFSPKIDSDKVVKLAKAVGVEMTIGEADEFLKNHLAYLGTYLQRSLECRIMELIDEK